MKQSLAIIVGTGFGGVVRDLSHRPIEVETRWGKVANGLFEVEIGSSTVLMLLRHGEGHSIPPHRIDHKANIAALHARGVSHVVSFSSAGSLRRVAPVGTFVVPTDFVDFTHVITTFFDDEVRHTSMAEAFDLRLSRLVLQSVRRHAPCSIGGSYVGIAGPRYPSRAEVRLFRDLGTLIGMTVVPEVVLSNELGLRYAGCALVTDDDVTVKHDNVVAALPNRRASFSRMLEDLVKGFASFDGRGPRAKVGVLRRLRMR